MWAPKGFTRRTGVRVSMYWNFIIHQIFSEFLQPLQDRRTQRVAPFDRGFLLICFWHFSGLVNIRSPRSLINRSWHRYGRDVTLSLILSFSSQNFTNCRWRRRAGRRWWAMTLLSWKFPWIWWRSWRWTWQVWNHNRNQVFRVAGILTPFLMRCGFWPLIHS